MKNSKKAITAVVAVCILGMFAYIYVPTLAEQPGNVNDPLVTQRFVEDRIAELSEEISALRGLITSSNRLPASSENLDIPLSERDALFAEVMEYFEIVYGERLNSALENIPPPGNEPQVVVFEVLNPQAGQIILFNAGAEFILRGGRATAVTGAINGIPDVTAGVDVMNGQEIGLNHLMMMPVTDGRGIHVHSEAWLMVRGEYSILN